MFQSPSELYADLRRLIPTRRSRRAQLLGFLGILPLLVWWLGWFPGFITSDSVDQLGQADRFEFFNFHPWFHTFTIWVVTRVWDNPGMVSLVQVIAMAGLLAVVASRLTDLGVPLWLAVGTVWFVAALPMVAATTIALWKDVPYTLALVWAFAELLAMARDPNGFWAGRWGPARLGLALALMWLFRHNGFLTVIPIVAAIVVWRKRRWRDLVPAGAALLGALVLTQGLLINLLPVEAATIEASQVFISDVAASYTHEPGNFSTEEVALLIEIAPLYVWTDRYDCHDSTALGFHPQFDTAALRANAGEFRSLVLRTVLRDLDTVGGHRWCAASYLLVPPQPSDAFFHRPPYDVAPNTLGISRDPVSDRAFDLTFDAYVWVEPEGRLWFTWRPALVIWLGIITYAALWWRRPFRRLLWPGGLLLAQLVNVAATTPAQEFRFAFGIYVAALLSLPLWWLVVRPSQAALVPAIVDGRPDHDAGSRG